MSESCDRCQTWLDETDFDGAGRFAGEQAWRFVLAHLNDDPGAKERVVERIGDCPKCLRGFASYIADFFSAVLLSHVGKQNALAIAGVYLDQILNAPDLEDLLGGRPT